MDGGKAEFNNNEDEVVESYSILLLRSSRYAKRKFEVDWILSRNEIFQRGYLR